MGLIMQAIYIREERLAYFFRMLLISLISAAILIPVIFLISGSVLIQDFSMLFWISGLTGAIPGLSIFFGTIGARMLYSRNLRHKKLRDSGDVSTSTES